MLQTRVSYRRGCIREEPWLGRDCTLAKVKVGFLPCIPIITAGGGSRLPFPHILSLTTGRFLCFYILLYDGCMAFSRNWAKRSIGKYQVNWLLGLPEAFLMALCLSWGISGPWHLGMVLAAFQYLDLFFSVELMGKRCCLRQVRTPHSLVVFVMAIICT